MGRRENESLYVPVGVPKKKTRYELLAEKYMLPPLPEITRTIVRSLIICAAVIVILLISGLRLKNFESDTGATYRYFGWMFGKRPTLGVMYISDGTKASVRGGAFYYSDGSVYEGETQGFMKHGQGRLEFADGSVYTGGFEYDKYSGRGKLTKKDGSFYEGEFKNGVYHGKGTLFIAGLGTYTGEFHKGEKSGSGTFAYESGDTFVGTYKNGIRTEGVYTWKAGDSIEGKFVSNMPSLTEKLIYTDVNGRTFKAYYDYVSASLTEKQAYLRPVEPEPEPEKPDDGGNAPVG